MKNLMSDLKELRPIYGDLMFDLKKLQFLYGERFKKRFIKIDSTTMYSEKLLSYLFFYYI